METQENPIIFFNANDITDSIEFWHFDRIISDLKLLKPKFAIFFSIGEFELSGSYFNKNQFEKLDNICDNLDINYYFIFGAQDDLFYSNFNNLNLKKVRFLYWPTYLLHYTYYQSPPQSQELLSTLKLNKKFTKLFVSLNYKPHRHRQLLMDKLCEFNLIENQNISWNVTTKEFYGEEIGDGNKHIFKFWNEQKLIIDKEFERNGGHDTWITDYYINNTINKCLINLVAESTTRCQFISEKTWKPLLVGQLFLCYGSKNQNNVLRKYGIDLYDEIFHYGYEEYDDLEKRADGIVYNLLKLKDLDYEVVYDMLEYKIEKNKKRVLSIIDNDPYIPHELIELYKKYHVLFENNKVHQYVGDIMKKCI